MSLTFPINCQFLDQLCNKDSQVPQGLKTTNESCFIPKYKLSLGIPIQILITNNIFQCQAMNQRNRH